MKTYFFTYSWLQKLLSAWHYIPGRHTNIMKQPPSPRPNILLIQISFQFKRLQKAWEFYSSLLCNYYNKDYNAPRQWKRKNKEHKTIHLKIQLYTIIRDEISLPRGKVSRCVYTIHKVRRCRAFRALPNLLLSMWLTIRKLLIKLLIIISSIVSVVIKWFWYVYLEEWLRGRP